MSPIAEDSIPMYNFKTESNKKLNEKYYFVKKV